MNPSFPCRSTLLVSLAVVLGGPLTAAVVFASAAGAEYDTTDRSTQISLRSGIVDTRFPDAAVPEHLRAGSGDGSDAYVLVKYPAPINAEQRRALEISTERIYTYLPHFAFLVRRSPGLDGEALRTAVQASWVGPYHPAYKLSPSLSATAAISATAATEEGASTGLPTQVMLHVVPDADLSQVLGKIQDLGIDSLVGAGETGRFQRVRLLLTADEIVHHRDTLARIPEVFWIDTEGRRVLRNDTTVWVGQSGLNGTTQTTVFDHGIYGQGQILAVLDTGIDPDMCYFRDPAAGPTAINACDGGTTVDLDQRKLIAVNFLWDADCDGAGIEDDEWDDQDHGTHVAGTAAGDNFTAPLLHDPGDGMAPGARLVVQDGGFSPDNCADLPGLGCPVIDLIPLFQQAYDQGARIHSNSWGDQENAGSPQSYSAGSQDADQFMWDNKDFLLVFAAGNAGPGGTVLSPSNAKSVISIGATQRGFSANNMANFSSCGPTFDGRIKPEVTVPGSSIISANSDNDASSNNCNTRSLSGTSMSAPGAAGFAALIRQYFEEGWYPSGAAEPVDAFTPSAALLRASLVNSARPMTLAPNSIPGVCQGWGRVLLEDMMHFAGDDRQLWVVDDPDGFGLGSSDEVREWLLDISDPSESLEITLAWTDFPSTPAADPSINNDLDLEVVGPDGAFYLGNVFISGESESGGSADRLNTLEQVLLLEPTVGRYTVRVRSFNVPDGPQPFALLATGSLTALPTAIFSDGFESGNISAWQ